MGILGHIKKLDKEFSESNKKFNQAFYPILMILLFLFIVGVIIFLTLGSAFAWTIDDLCLQQANNSIPEYLNCKNYFNQLNQTQNQTTIINQTIIQNYTTTTNSSDPRYYELKSYIDSEISRIKDNYARRDEIVSKSDYYSKIDTYSKTEIDNKLDAFKQLNDLNNDKNKLEMFNDFKDELKNGGWLEQIVNYQPNISLSGYVKYEDLQNEIERYNQGGNNIRKQDNTFYYILAAIALIIVYYFYNENKKRREEERTPVHNRFDEEKMHMKSLLEKQNETIKRQQAEFDELNQKIGNIMKKAYEIKKGEEQGAYNGAGTDKF